MHNVAKYNLHYKIQSYFKNMIIYHFKHSGNTDSEDRQEVKHSGNTDSEDRSI